MQRMLPPVYFSIAVMAMLALHLLLPVATLVPWPWSLVGVLAIVLGAGLTVLADRRFKQVGITVRPLERSDALVIDGPSSCCRRSR